MLNAVWLFVVSLVYWIEEFLCLEHVLIYLTVVIMFSVIGNNLFAKEFSSFEKKLNEQISSEA